MNFMYLRRLSTFSSPKLELAVDSEISYGLISMTSSSSTLPPSFFVCSSLIYNS